MLNENFDNQTGYIVINSDDWADVGQLYKVVEYSRKIQNQQRLNW